ncbi:ATP-binding protein [Agrobacterium sp. CCNWLW71]
MDQLINAILKISRDGQRKLQPEKVDIETLLSSLSETVRHQINANGGEIEVDTPKLTIVTDRISLDQILGNLFDNAVKYQMPGRPLRLTARAYPAGRGAICIEVADNGRGIGEQDLERVFELFRRAGNQDQPGEGIGLAHVRSLVMIEDDEGHARLIEKNVRRAGVNNEIVPFTLGAKALDFILGESRDGLVSKDRYLLVLLDLNLPDMSGINILEQIKSNEYTRRLPVVVLTTTDDETEIQKCYDLGANVYITKPVDYEGFANAIKNLGLFFSVIQIP